MLERKREKERTTQRESDRERKRERKKKRERSRPRSQTAQQHEVNAEGLFRFHAIGFRDFVYVSRHCFALELQKKKKKKNGEKIIF